MFMFQAGLGACVALFCEFCEPILSNIKVVLGLPNLQIVAGSTQGYGCMVGAPQHALKTKLDIPHEQAAAFQDKLEGPSTSL